MAIELYQLPYDSGHRGARMGRGPLHLVEHGDLLDRLTEIDPKTRLIPLECVAPFRTEIGAAFELGRALAQAIAAGARTGSLPLVLAGNCNSSIGTVAGLQAAPDDAPLGVVWFDGHGDCNTPETFTGDFLDAMGLSTLTGRCWHALAETVPGFRPLPDEHVLLVGAHGADEGAKSVLAASEINQVSSDAVRALGASAALGPALDRMVAKGVGRIYIHLDVDVLDAEQVAPANQFAPSGGLLADHIAESVDAIAARFRIAAAGVASYDPDFDRADRVSAVAQAFLRQVASIARASRG